MKFISLSRISIIILPVRSFVRNNKLCSHRSRSFIHINITMKIYLFGFAIFTFVYLCSTYKTGAPPEVCKDMIPQHGIPPKPLPSPYTVKVDKTKVSPGGKVVVTISSDKEPSFKGFLIQARDNSSNIVGSFTQTFNTKTIDCGSKGSKNAITHNSPDDKSSLSLTWTAPQTVSRTKKTIRFVASIAKDGGEFWVGEKSAPVIVG